MIFIEHYYCIYKNLLYVKKNTILNKNWFQNVLFKLNEIRIG